MNMTKSENREKHAKTSFQFVPKLNIRVDHSDTISFSIHASVLDKKIFKD